MFVNEPSEFLEDSIIYSIMGFLKMVFFNDRLKVYQYHRENIVL